VPRPDVTLELGGTTIDLRARALVAGAVPAPRFAREGEVLAAVAAVRSAGADLADVSLAPRLVGSAAQRGGLPIAARADTVAHARALGAAGAAVVLVPPAVAGDAATAAVTGAYGVDDVTDAGAGARWQPAVVVDDLGALTAGGPTWRPGRACRWRSTRCEPTNSSISAAR
jgi:hypothetical protein